MPGRVGNGRTWRPCGVHDVGVVVEFAFKMSNIDFILRENGFMRIRLAPIRRLHVARAVGKMNLNCQPSLFQQRRLDAHGDAIQFWIANGFHFHRLAVEFEMADNFAVP